jgi:predicted nucleic acid-binding protein
MSFLLDSSVAVRWFVDQPGAERAHDLLDRFAREPGLLVAPDLLRFELTGALARLQTRRRGTWAERCVDRFDRLGIRTLPTTLGEHLRALELSRELKIGGYDAIYLAHAESLGIPWLTADARMVRRLRGDPRIRAL